MVFIEIINGHKGVHMFKTLIVEEVQERIVVTMNRAKYKNSINELMLDEFHILLDQLETVDKHKILVIQGDEVYFCTGMDLKIFERESTNDSQASKQFCEKYMLLLKKISLLPKAVISIIDGQVMAGGVGIVAVSDIVIATPRSTFILSEALWGLLPSMVLPYLSRRIGCQNAYKMTLTATRIEAANAREINLVDILTDDTRKSLNFCAMKFSRISNETIKEIKLYFKKLWIINEKIENMGIEETNFLANKECVKRNIVNFTKYNIFPWET